MFFVNVISASFLAHSLDRLATTAPRWSYSTSWASCPIASSLDKLQNASDLLLRHLNIIAWSMTLNMFQISLGHPTEPARLLGLSGGTWYSNAKRTKLLSCADCKQNKNNFITPLQPHATSLSAMTSFDIPIAAALSSISEHWSIHRQKQYSAVKCSAPNKGKYREILFKYCRTAVESTIN